ILRACGAIISGSVALKFFLPGEHWTPHDLDIYVPDRMFDTFISIVTKDPKIQFRSVPNSPRAPRRSARPGTNGIRQVLRFRTETNLHVDIIRSAVHSPLTPLHFYWTTLVMNFITPDACACGFPDGTLTRRGILR
ncbi:hypothetical protein C8Q76DRAFT_596427, partial [Earliella scabrosa]